MKESEIKTRRAEFTCGDYSPQPGHFKCQHYVGQGACGLPDYMMCVEWLKKNPDQALTAPAAKSKPKKEKAKTLTLAPPLREPAAPPTRPQLPQLRPLIEQPELLTEKQVEDLSALGLEVELSTDHSGAVVLVPAYTGADRLELTYQDCRTLVTTLQVFPGAKLERITKKLREISQGNKP